jgi:toxin FitB
MAFRAWLRAHDEELFLSVITLAEIQAGVFRLERKRATRRAADLAHWLSAILELYQSRTLTFAANAALETGRMLDRAMAAGASPGFEDAAIAATAAVHGLTVVTANERHFKCFGVAFIPPPIP